MAPIAASDAYLDDSVSFDSFRLDPRLLQAIKTLGFKSPTLVQAKAIPLALEQKRDIIAKASTGSGKTAAYAIPIIQSVLTDPSPDIQAIVLVPTRELASQVTQFFDSLTKYCGASIKTLNLSSPASNLNESILLAMLLEKPDIIISTPSKLVDLLAKSKNVLDLKNLKYLCIDEVDLVLSYGYDQDLENLSNYLVLKQNLQIFLMSATIDEDVNKLKAKFCRAPAILRLNDELINQSKLVQYYVKTSEFDKFLLCYVIFKLQLIKGKTLCFVNNIDRGYRLKLFLEQFGIKACVLNSELPINSRLHIVEEFNKNVYNLLIATDETNDFTKEIDEDDKEEDEEEDNNEEGKSQKRPKKSKQDKEYGVSRGVDFQNVACVLNFDLPITSRAYVHRIGRTARAGKSGMALSFVVDQKTWGKHKQSSLLTAKKDERILAKIVKQQTRLGFELKPYTFDMKQVDGFRYRMEDGFRAVTGAAIREARIKEIKNELLTSDKLKRHFEENPQDYQSLRHDKELHPARVQQHLKRVPEYLLPESARTSNGKKLGFVPFNKVTKKRSGRRKPKKVDPLKSFKR